jgi:hypothetical protein
VTLLTGELVQVALAMSAGDGAGVGKGRQIAATIKEFWCALRS